MTPAPPAPPPAPPVMSQPPQHHMLHNHRGSDAPSSGNSSPEKNNMFANAKLRKASVVNDRSKPVLR